MDKNRYNRNPEGFQEFQDIKPGLLPSISGMTYLAMSYRFGKICKFISDRLKEACLFRQKKCVIYYDNLPDKLDADRKIELRNLLTTYGYTVNQGYDQEGKSNRIIISGW